MQSDLGSAWRAAASDLGIRVETPYVMTVSPTHDIQCIAFLPEFGSRRGTVIRSTADADQPPLRNLVVSTTSLSPEVYGSYDRHVWIDLLESLRWFAPGTPPSWYTAISPWHDDAAVLLTVTDHLTRIFGEPVPVEKTALCRYLDLMPANDLLEFLARVPTRGATRQSFFRWVVDVADEWERARPRRPSSER